MKLLTIPVLVLFAFLPAFADSVNVTDTFNLFVIDRVVDHHPVLIQLTPNGNPLVHAIDPNGPILQFDVLNVFSPTEQLHVLADITLAGKLTELSLDGDALQCPQPQPCGFSFVVTTPFFPQPVQGSITLTIEGGQTETFNFRYSSMAATTPEPASLSLLSMGLAAVVWRKYGRKRGQRVF